MGLYMWVHFLLPMLSSKSSCNPQSRDLILQLVERFETIVIISMSTHFSLFYFIFFPNSKLILISYRVLSSPKARSILLNGAVRKGERIVPPSALEHLMRATFPAPSARVKVCVLYIVKDQTFDLVCFFNKHRKGNMLCSGN